jgi:hypothetical protein
LPVSAKTGDIPNDLKADLAAAQSHEPSFNKNANLLRQYLNTPSKLVSGQEARQRLHQSRRRQSCVAVGSGARWGA